MCEGIVFRDRMQVQALVNATFRVTQKAGNTFNSSTPVTVSRTTPLHGVNCRTVSQSNRTQAITDKVLITLNHIQTTT